MRRCLMGSWSVWLREGGGQNHFNRRHVQRMEASQDGGRIVNLWIEITKKLRQESYWTEWQRARNYNQWRVRGGPRNQEWLTVQWVVIMGTDVFCVSVCCCAPFHGAFIFEFVLLLWVPPVSSLSVHACYLAVSEEFFCDLPLHCDCFIELFFFFFVLNPVGILGYNFYHIHFVATCFPAASSLREFYCSFPHFKIVFCVVTLPIFFFFFFSMEWVWFSWQEITVEGEGSASFSAQGLHSLCCAVLCCPGGTVSFLLCLSAPSLV